MIQIHLDLKDKEYQAALGEKLAWRYAGQREICLHHFADEVEREEMLASVPTNKSLWLMSAEHIKENAGVQANILKMTESPAEEADACFCYQPLSQMQKQLTETLYRHQLIERVTEREDSCEFLYLYSPFGGIGVSSLAYRLAKEYSGKEKVLLVSFDAYHNFEQEFIAFRLSDVLFYRETMKQINIEDFCHHSGKLDILHGPRMPQDLEVLKSKPKSDFMEQLASAGYRKIIFDLSSSGMELWCRPQETGEHFFVIKRPAEKWKQFSITADYDFTPVSEENAFMEIIEIMREKRC